VPDALNQLTSDHGWDTIKEQAYLKEIITRFKKAGIRVSIFVDPNEAMVEAAATTGTDRIELYTESYAKAFEAGKKEDIIEAYRKAAEKAKQLGLGINAGHNLPFLVQQIPFIDEVSIGHALISDALYLGLENTIQLYKRALSPLK
jgi:pyridoxine 5-phosphate synthase